jgi:hypothetical protein
VSRHLQQLTGLNEPLGHHILRRRARRTTMSAPQSVSLLGAGVMRSIRCFPHDPVHNQALYELARALLSANGTREYRQAATQLDRLLREHPTSTYTTDAKAWRAVLQLLPVRTAGGSLTTLRRADDDRRIDRVGRRRTRASR